MTSFSHLPDDLIVVIFLLVGKTSIPELGRAGIVSKRFLKCFNSDVLWKDLSQHFDCENTEREAEESWKDFFRRFTDWRWDNEKKAGEEIVISNSGITVSRPTTAGSNPAVMSVLPFSTSRNFYEVMVNKMGDWISIGVAKANLQLDGGGVLIPSFFCQGVSKIQTHDSCVTQINEEIIPVLKDGDKVGLAISSDARSICYFLNGEFLYKSVAGPVKDNNRNLWFPALGVSYNTTVTFTSRVRPYPNEHINLSLIHI
eukprot:TRINITY_DN187_c0_g1_i1.p1 TRINITY_DN187_c0_g1~~TRINITY_DN187_c0_g1_i1.p1  ORF type:complete len:257 (-),score=40.28 TRINITY_DN187_c0_g1_i1:50-820(-)